MTHDDITDYFFSDCYTEIHINGSQAIKRRVKFESSIKVFIYCFNYSTIQFLKSHFSARPSECV